MKGMDDEAVDRLRARLTFALDVLSDCEEILPDGVEPGYGTPLASTVTRVNEATWRVRAALLGLGV